MKNTFKKLLLLILSAIVCMGSFSVIGCGDNASSGNNNDVPSQGEVVTVGDSTSAPSFAKTEIDLVKNGVTEYVVVIPAAVTSYENFAKDELVMFFQQATSATLPVVTDQTATYDTSKKYISVGQTALLAKSGITIDPNELDRDGHIVKRDGNIIFLAGALDYGTIQAVYSFLKINFDWDFLSATEIYMNKGLNFKVLDYNLKNIPAIVDRGSVGHTAWDGISAMRMGYSQGGSSNKLFGEESWYYFPHTTFKLVTPESNAAAHPDWYAASKGQPCFSSEGFKEALIKAAKGVIAAKPELDYLPIGAEDSMEYCNCARCELEKESYTRCGQIVRWANDVISELDAYVKQNFPGRKLLFPVLGYYDTEYAPVNRDATTGELTPIDPSCVLHESAPVIFAPMNTGKSYYCVTDPENNNACNYNLEAWKICSPGGLMFYMYGGNDMRSFEWLDMLVTYADNAQVAKDIELLMFHQQGNHDYKNGWAMDAMIAYVFSKILWDPSVNVPDLVQNFITRYYHEAGDIMLQYYYLMKTHYKVAYLNNNVKSEKWDTPSGLSAGSSAALEKKGFLEQMDALLDDAVAAINAADYTQAEKDTIIERIELERFTIRFALIEYFVAEYQTDEYLQMIDEFEANVYRYGIKYIMSRHQGNYTNEKKLREWRDRKA